MLPSWFTKLRDVKALSKQSKLQVKQHGSPPRSLKKREARASLAKSFSLRRASTKVQNTRFETEIRDACTNEDNACCSLTSNEYDVCNDIQDYHNLQSSSGLYKDSACALFLTDDCRLQDGCNPARGTAQVEAALKDMSSKYDDVQLGTVCKGTIMSKLLSGEEKIGSIEKGHVVFDHNTEEFSFTSETSSSYGSERSSSDSSGGRKCSVIKEEVYQGDQVWQGGFRKPGSICRCERDRVGSSGQKLSVERKRSRDGVEMMSRLTEEAVEAQSLVLDQLQGARRCSFHTSSISSADSDDVRDCSSSSNADKTSLIIRKWNCFTERCSSLIERNATRSSLRLHWDEDCALYDNPIRKQQVSDREVPLKPIGETIGYSTAIVNPAFNIEDRHRTSTCDEPDLLDESFRQEERNSTLCIIGSPEMTARSTRCSQIASFDGDSPGKCSILQMQRTRQRHSSISAVLPPDLQGVVGDSLALVMISDDPYEDFRQSMYEMIIEKDLEGSMDVEELLYCYLSLNSPEHHELIEEVFSDVWSAILMTMR